MDLVARARTIPAQAEIDGQLAGHLPVVLEVQRPGILSPLGILYRVDLPAVGKTEQEAGIVHTHAGAARERQPLKQLIAGLLVAEAVDALRAARIPVGPHFLSELGAGLVGVAAADVGQVEHDVQLVIPVVIRVGRTQVEAQAPEIPRAQTAQAREARRIGCRSGESQFLHAIELQAAGLRAEVDDRAERMQAKLRDAQEQKVPLMVVVGDRDQEARAVSPRVRSGDASQGVPLDDFVTDLAARVARRELWPR